jgi:hypothetical protein
MWPKFSDGLVCHSKMERVLVVAEERYDITGLPPMYCVSHGNEGMLLTEEPDIQEQFVLNE